MVKPLLAEIRANAIWNKKNLDPKILLLDYFKKYICVGICVYIHIYVLYKGVFA